MPTQTQQIHADLPSRGMFGFFRDIGVRETIESIVIAIIMALMFRAYETEAFIIPTGSMAPSLQGQHMDLECDKCNLRYRAGASYESPVQIHRDTMVGTHCPICQYRTRMRRSEKIFEKVNAGKPGIEPDHFSNNGDRILVNKFIYDFQDPQRYDVIVFKNPSNGKQNYIKRLIGLPGENILIENGDIYVMHDPGNGVYKKEITRKPPRKLRHVLQVVDDTFHIGEDLKDVGWPSRWDCFDGIGSWVSQDSGGNPEFSAKATDKDSWLRYRHFQPAKNEWPTIENGDLPGRFKNGLPKGSLIGDQYAYNDGVYSQEANEFGQPNGISNLGLHWVGDLGIHLEARVRSSTGTLMFDVVEGGAHFICSIDVSTGKATLKCDDLAVDTKVTFVDANGKAVPEPTGQTNLKGAGTYKVEYVNADDRINLWINNKLVEFDAAEYTRIGIPVPTYSKTDAGDAEPVRIGASGLDVDVTHIKVVRDLYYTSIKGVAEQNYMDNETGESTAKIMELHQNPDKWQNAVNFFEKKKKHTEPMFRLEKKGNDAKDQFLPMGDNSPKSLDGRLFPGGKHYVERDLLIGRAMLIYWPHTLNKPFKYFPNFKRMGFIR